MLIFYRSVPEHRHDVLSGALPDKECFAPIWAEDRLADRLIWITPDRSKSYLISGAAHELLRTFQMTALVTPVSKQGGGAIDRKLLTIYID